MSVKNIFKELSYDGKRILYVDNVSETRDNPQSNCRLYIKKYLIPRDHPVKKHVEILMTTRRCKGSDDLFKPGNIYLDADELDTFTNDWSCIACTEQVPVLDLFNQYKWRFYCLGFLKTSRLRDLCKEKLHPTTGREAQTIVIQGIPLQKPFYMVHSRHFSIEEAQDMVEEYSPKEETTTEHASTLEEKQQEEIPPIMAMRQTVTHYVYIVQWDGIKQGEIIDMMDLEKEVLERLKMLASLMDGTLEQEPAYNVRRWFMDRRCIFVLLLIMCWDQKIRRWYVSAEKLYTKTVCSKLTDIDDFVLNCQYNDLTDVIKITSENREFEELSNQFASVQVYRIRKYMMKWVQIKKKPEHLHENLKILMKKCTSLFETFDIE